MLTLEETTNYLRLAKNGDESAKEILVVNNSSLIKSVVKRFNRKGVEYDDLYQLASLGFVKAIYNFDESFGVKFSTYAVPMIVGEIKRYMRDDGIVKVSRIIKNLSFKINAYTESLAKEGKALPTINEIAEKFEVERDDVVLALGSLKPLVSLSETVDGDSDKPIELIEKLPSCEGEEDIVDRIFLKQMVDELPDRERRIIVWRYFSDKTQSEVAKLLGVSQVQVSRIEASVLKKLKSKM